MSDVSNETAATVGLNCPVYTESDQIMVNDVSFWMEGVVQTSIAISGILFNVFSSLILAAKDMRNSFNLLLIALACYDSCYLFGSILESFRKCFGLVTDIHTLMFPYFLYPGQMIMMTASVFMTVAIAMERYVAVNAMSNAALLIFLLKAKGFIFLSGALPSRLQPGRLSPETAQFW